MAMNHIETVLLENIDKPDSLFIFPTDIAASRWADHLLRLRYRSGAFTNTVAMDKFIAWDTFKQNSIRSKIQNKKSIPAIMRKMFMASLIRENALLCSRNEPPVFSFLIQPEWAQYANSYTGWLTRILPQLGIWFRQAAKLPIGQITGEEARKLAVNFTGDERDLYNIALYYTEFLEKHGLFEPAWETPPFEDFGKKCFIFFPESLSDFGEYRALLEESVNVTTVRADIYEPENFEVFFYTNARSEITEAALYIMALHKNQNISWDAISVSIPETGNYGPYLFREFDNRNIPYVRQSGKPLASYPSGQFFSALKKCVSDNFSFASLTSLLSNRHLPWKEEEKNQNLLQFGIDNNCICSWTEEKGKEEIPINVWEDAFVNSTENYKYLYAFFKKIIYSINSICYADSFSAIRKYYFEFRRRFFDMEKCLSETNLVLSRCITELNYLVEIENSYPDVRVPDPFAFFTGCLEETSYLAQQPNSGVAILPYRTAAPAPFDCHIILGASQDSLSAVFYLLPFLMKNKREKLGILDEDVSEVFINLHIYNSVLPAVFFVSEQVFSGYTIPHSALGAALKPNQRYSNDIQFEKKFYSDLFRFENEHFSSFHFATDRQTQEQKLPEAHKNQNQGFENWALRRKFPGTGKNLENGNAFTELVRNRFLYKGNDNELSGKYSVSSSSLALYFQCPLKLFFSRVLELQDAESETSLMGNEIPGKIYHRILHLFLKELIENNEIISPPRHYGLPEEYSNILIKKTDEVFDSFPYLGDGSLRISMLAVRLLKAEKELFLSRLEIFLLKFISFFAGHTVIASEIHCIDNKSSYYLNGYIDCILEDKQGSLVIVDFKTKKMPDLQACKGGGDEGLADFQLPMYIRLAEKKYGKNAETALFFSITDSIPLVLFGKIQDSIKGNCIPKKEADCIVHGSSEYKRIMGEFIKKSEQFSEEITNGTYSFSASYWELCPDCDYNKVCRTLYIVCKGEKQWHQTTGKSV